jgi:hypothetical protein
VNCGSGGEFQSVFRDTNDNSALLVWNTTFDAPGWQSVQPSVFLKNYDGDWDHQPVTTGVGPALMTVVSNGLQFNPFYSHFDDSGATLYAWTSPGTAYSIELIGANGAHLKTITGSVSSETNEISEDWNRRQHELIRGRFVHGPVYDNAAWGAKQFCDIGPIKLRF